MVFRDPTTGLHRTVEFEAAMSTAESWGVEKAAAIGAYVTHSTYHGRLQQWCVTYTYHADGTATDGMLQRLRWTGDACHPWIKIDGAGSDRIKTSRP